MKKKRNRYGRYETFYIENEDFEFIENLHQVIPETDWHCLADIYKTWSDEKERVWNDWAYFCFNVASEYGSQVWALYVTSYTGRTYNLGIRFRYRWKEYQALITKEHRYLWEIK